MYWGQQTQQINNIKRKVNPLEKPHFSLKYFKSRLEYRYFYFVCVCLCVLAKLIVTSFHHLKEYQKPETIMLIMIAYRPALDV